MTKKLFIPLTLLCFSSIFAQSYGYNQYGGYEPMPSYESSQKSKPTVVIVKKKHRPMYRTFKAVIGGYLGLIVTVLMTYGGYMAFKKMEFLSNLFPSFGEFKKDAVGITQELFGRNIVIHKRPNMNFMPYSNNNNNSSMINTSVNDI